MIATIVSSMSSRSCSSCRSSCSCTSSATTGSPGATACGSRCSRSASGPELFGWNDRHGTRWKFCAIPLGGYVKMLGDADAASATVDPAHAPRPGQLPGQERLAAHGDRRRRAGRQFRLRDRGAGDPVHRRGPAVHAGRGRRRASRTARRPPPASLPGDRIIAVDGSADRELRGAAGASSATVPASRSQFVHRPRRRDRSRSR